MKLGVYIQSNRRQHVGALVSAYSIRRGAADPTKFSITIMNTEDARLGSYLRAAEGKTFIREGKTFTWRNDVLQSFPPLRFAPPELQGFEGRALVVDPDVFAFGDVLDLLIRDMQGKAILCRQREGEGSHLTTSVMLLDCAKLTHWQFQVLFDKLLNKEIEWTDWMRLRDEPSATIGFFEPEWNDFDNLTPRTKLLHNTKQKTQPWRTGLLVDPKAREEKLVDKVRYFIRNLTKPPQRHERHPDPAQELAFFALLREGMERGDIPRPVVEAAAANGDIRRDALKVASGAPVLPEKSSEIAAFLAGYRSSVSKAA
jgi:hypothetical protein